MAGPKKNESKKNPSTKLPTSWADFQTRLETQIKKLPDKEYIILGIASRFGIENAYVQFRRDGKIILCEAVSNTYVIGATMLSEEKEMDLVNLGWKEPNHSGNWNIVFKDENRFSAAAKLLTKTARSVYGALKPSDVTYSSSFSPKDFPAEPYSPEANATEASVEPPDTFDIQKLGDTFYGVSPFGTYTIGLSGEVYQVTILPQGPLCIKQIRIRVVNNTKPSLEKRLPKMSKFVREAGGYQLQVLEENEETDLWLLKVGLAERSDINRDKLLDDLIILSIDVRWARAYLGA